ncbi:MAG: hypothetical protein ACI9O2_000306, partial [Flammeovirgaceae bacterium]
LYFIAYSDQADAIVEKLKEQEFNAGIIRIKR